MIMHFNLGTNDLERAEAFYTELLSLFEARLTIRTRTAVFYDFGDSGARLAINTPFDGKPATSGNGSMVALSARNVDQVDAVYARAMELGATSEGEPGSRRNGRIYAAYFRDPDGNKFGVIFPTVISGVSNPKPVGG